MTDSETVDPKTNEAALKWQLWTKVAGLEATFHEFLQQKRVGKARTVLVDIRTYMIPLLQLIGASHPLFADLKFNWNFIEMQFHVARESDSHMILFGVASLDWYIRCIYFDARFWLKTSLIVLKACLHESWFVQSYYLIRGVQKMQERVRDEEVLEGMRTHVKIFSAMQRLSLIQKKIDRLAWRLHEAKDPLYEKLLEKELVTQGLSKNKLRVVNKLQVFDSLEVTKNRDTTLEEVPKTPKEAVQLLKQVEMDFADDSAKFPGLEDSVTVIRGWIEATKQAFGLLGEFKGLDF